MQQSHAFFATAKLLVGLRINRRQNGSNFKHFDAVDPDATDFGEIMQNNGHDSESPSLVQRKLRMRFPISE